MENKYTLPKLDYSSLSPFISEEQLRIHHEKHHKAYVEKANKILERMEESRRENTDIEQNLKSLSFNVGGHILHSLFWKNMSPSGEEPKGDILAAIEKEFGNFERFKEEFAKATLGVEGSGWGVLTYEKESKRLLIGQLEKHNLFLYPDSAIIMVIDIWEHAYYLDYKNEKAKFMENFWSIVDWEEVNKRFKISSS